MKKIIVLKVLDKDVRPRNIVRCSDCETHIVIAVRNNKRAIRKIVRKNNDQLIVVNHNSKKGTFFENCTKYYNEISIEVVLPVIEKICRAASVKYNLKLPLEDICLYAQPAVAYKFIENLIGISRIFTVVTKEPLGEQADKLYFEYGCLIRHIQKPEKEKKDTISLFIEKSGVSFSPIINITPDIITGEKVIDVREIAVLDKEIEKIDNDIGGVNGLFLYNLLEKIPSKNIEVNINKKADTIFLLDTKAF